MRTARYLYSLVPAFLLSVGCGGGGGGGGTGTLALRLTDAPFPDAQCLSQALVEVSGAEVQSETGWLPIPLNATQFDLLDLQNGLDTNLAIGQLPTGTYHQIRLIVDSATLVFTDTTTKTFTVPSGMQTGIKINVNPEFLVAAGQTTTLLLDFSLAESFHVTGVGGAPTCDDLKSNETMFDPVIHATNLDVTGVLTGVVYYDDGTTPAPSITVTVFAAGADPTTDLPVTTTLSADGTMDNAPIGSYAVHLDAGSYDLYAPNADSSDIELVAPGVTVTAQQITTQDLTTSIAAP